MMRLRRALGTVALCWLASTMAACAECAAASLVAVVQRRPCLDDVYVRSSDQPERGP